MMCREGGRVRTIVLTRHAVNCMIFSSRKMMMVVRISLEHFQGKAEYFRFTVSEKTTQFLYKITMSLEYSFR